MDPLKSNKTGSGQILLITLPFLTPLIPPVGISCLKSYLNSHGYEVKTVDGMSDMDLRELTYHYFDTMKEYIPTPLRGHYFNVGLDVLLNHFMAHINHKNPDKYRRLVKMLVYWNFFVNINDDQADQLTGIVDRFYTRLESFLLSMIEKEKPGLLGLSVYKGTLASSVFAARIIKHAYPLIKIIMGGTIFSQELFPGSPNFQRFAQCCPFIDHFFIGESEQLFLSYLKGQLAEDQRVYTLKDINDRILELDNIEVPDYSDFDLSKYTLLGAFTSRGCTYRCSFCAETVYWKKYHRQTPQKVADSLVQLSETYGRNTFVLTDCLINPLVTELSEELLRRDIKVYWDVYLRVDHRVGDPELTHLWRQGGFYRARLGIESGSQRMLDIIQKKITVPQIKEAISSLARAGIKTTTYWIAGHPGETEADFQETLKILEELQDDLYEAECDPFRYFYNGQVNAETWSHHIGNALLYPDEMTDMLLTQTYKLNTQPPREEIYRRQCRFREHCQKLGIPNPYSISEIHHADRRWQELHKNAVPPLLELNRAHKEPAESTSLNPLLDVQFTEIEDVDFGF